MQQGTLMPKKVDHYDDPEYDYGKYWEGRAYEHAAETMAINRLLEGKRFKHAIDIGGGYGRLSVVLTKYADTVTLIEPSNHQLKQAEVFLKHYSGISLRKLPADNLKLVDASVDLAVMIRVMHHLPDPEPELREISRVLTTDGYALIEVANYAHARNRLRHYVRREKMPLQPVDIRSNANRHEAEIPFVNHNPKTVVKQLAHVGLKVDRILSVSNLRSTKLKKLMPQRVLLAIEGVLQPTLARGYFGPSVFFLVKKAQ